MALINCKECGKEISKKAKECPHCGAPAKKKTSLFTWLVLIFIVFFGIAYCSKPKSKYSAPTTDTWIKNQSRTASTQTSNPSRSSSSSSSNSSSYSTPKPYTPPLEVLSWKCEKEYSYVHISGEVKNISDHSMENVMAVGEFRTKNGALVKSESSLIEYNPILPGQRSPFKTGGTDNPAITNCHISFTTLFGKKIDHKMPESLSDKKDKNKKVQNFLSYLGYKIGNADGIIGPKTTEAIKDFQGKHGLTQDGKVSDELIGKLSKEMDKEIANREKANQ